MISCLTKTARLLIVRAVCIGTVNVNVVVIRDIGFNAAHHFLPGEYSVAHRIHRLKAAVKRMRKRKTAYLISPMGGTQSTCSDRQADRSAQRAQTRGRNVSGVCISE